MKEVRERGKERERKNDLIRLIFYFASSISHKGEGSEFLAIANGLQTKLLKSSVLAILAQRQGLQQTSLKFS